MTEYDPRESPFYNGPELDGLSPSEKHEMRKQLRIAARNKARKLRSVSNPPHFPFWFGAMCVAFLAFSISLVVTLIMRH